MCTACCARLHFLYKTESIGVEHGILILSPGIERYIVKEGGISARNAGLLWGLSMKESTLHVRLNRRVTFDHQIEVPSPSFF